MSRHRNGGISCSKPEEPAFIRRMKEQIGYREGPTVDSKRELENDDLEEREDADDEKPTVVVLREGDLTADQAEEVQQEIDLAPGSGKMVFRKPDKKKLEEKMSKKTFGSSAKRSLEADDNDQRSSQSKSSKDTKKSKLLSFNEDEDEDL